MRTHALIRSFSRNSGLCLCTVQPKARAYTKQRNTLYFQTYSIFIHDCLWTVLFVLVVLWVFYCARYSNLAWSRSDSSNYFEEWQNPWQRLTNASCSLHLRAQLCRSESPALPGALMVQCKASVQQNQRWTQLSEMHRQADFPSPKGILQKTSEIWSTNILCRLLLIYFLDSSCPADRDEAAKITISVVPPSQLPPLN